MPTRFQIGNALQGFGEGYEGRGTQWTNQQRELTKDRKQAFVSDFERANVFMQNGEFDRAISLMNHRAAELAKLGAGTDSTDYGIGLAEIGDAEGFATFANSIYQGGVAQGLVERKPQSQPIPATAINEYGQVMTQNPDGSFSMSEIIEGYTPPAGNRPFQQGSSRLLKDEDGVLLERASVFNPASGSFENKYINLANGKDYTPVGTISGVNQSGMTAQESQDMSLAMQRRELDQAAAFQQGKNAFDTLPGINQSIQLYRDALTELENGANTGYLSNLFPSLRGPSISLDNIQQRLGLSIIQSVTFGALSEREMDVAMQVGLPTDLSESDLKIWLEDRIKAETKIRNAQAAAAAYLTTGASLESWIQIQTEQYPVPAWLEARMAQGENGQTVVEVTF